MNCGRSRVVQSSSFEPAVSIWGLVRHFLPYLYHVRWRVLLVGGLMLLNPLIAISLLWLMKLLIDDVFIAGEINLLPLFGFAYVVPCRR